ncbi:MAG: hypothetical protein WBG01_05570, partial [Bacteroidota bacterium]
MNRTRRTRASVRAAAILAAVLLVENCSVPSAQPADDLQIDELQTGTPWFNGFWSGARHWYATGEKDRIIRPLPSRPRYP